MTDLLAPARVAIRVNGVPIPQGSKVANRYGGGVRDANDKKLRPWRAKVRDEAIDTWRYFPTLTGPVRCWLRFTFERPASHYGTGRNAHRVKDSAPAQPIGRGLGDLDKFTRAIFDALTDAQVWADDALVVDVRARKFYAGEHELALDQASVVIILEEIS